MCCQKKCQIQHQFVFYLSFLVIVTMTKAKKGKRKSTMKVSLLKQIIQITSTVRQDTADLIGNISEFGCRIDLARVEVLEGMVRDLGHLSNLVGEAMEETIVDIEKCDNKYFPFILQATDSTMEQPAQTDSPMFMSTSTLMSTTSTTSAMDLHSYRYHGFS